METVTPLEEMPVPWGKQITLQEVCYEGGLSFIRVRIREGSRFTTLDLDAASAERLGETLLAWAGKGAGED